MISDSRSRRGWALLVGSILLVPMIVGQGCPSIGGGTGGTPYVAVRSPSLDQTVAAGQLVTLVYDAYGPLGAAVTVSAFYDRDGLAGSGDEVSFGTNLASGENKFTQFSTANLAPGVLYAGVVATNSAGSTVAYASGKVTVSAAPVLTFTSPFKSLSVGPGTAIPVNFSAGTGITNFTYRTFYDQDNTFDGDEITISTGTNTTSSQVNTTFDTTSLAPGTFYIGAHVSTSTGGTVTAYAPGAISIVMGAFVEVLSPTIGLVASPGTQVVITIAANDPSSSNSTVRIFYDTDDQFSNGSGTTIAVIPTFGSGTVWDTTDVAPGEYFIGAELQNGLEPPQVAYSSGPVVLVASAGGGPGGGASTILAMTSPQVPTTVLEGSTFRVNWLTNLKPGEGTITVFAEPDRDGDGVPDGEAARVNVPGGVGLDAATQFVDFVTTGFRGTFFIGATVTPNIGAASTAYAQGTLTIRPLQFWVGDLATRRGANGQVQQQTGVFQGATFRGHNPFDNLGTTMLSTDDYDGDRRSEILLGAQFAKPFNFARDGRGAGEAYLIYGAGSGRYRGDYNVNNVASSHLPGGTDLLPGVLFTGIIPNPFPGTSLSQAALAGTSVPFTVDGQPAPEFATEGLRSITLIPDQDRDGRREIVFGFPYCNSISLQYQFSVGASRDTLAGRGNLENNGHFLRGGVVLVSSQNPMLTSRTSTSRIFDRVMELHEVGQMFTGMVPPSSWTVQQDNCDGFNFNPGADGDNDTVVFPCDGFWQDTTAFISPPRLADPWGAGGLIIHPDNNTYGCLWPTNWLFTTQIDLPDPSFGGRVTSFPPFSCEQADVTFPPVGEMRVLGTGFYGTGDTCAEFVPGAPQAPYGCRILGQDSTQPSIGMTANRFGQSMSVSGDFLLIGAPLRTARSTEVPMLPTATRQMSGQVYMLELRRPGGPDVAQQYATPDLPNIDNIPYPHNFIIRDLGYHRHSAGCNPVGSIFGDAQRNIGIPFAVVGAAPGDQVSEVTGLKDINNDGVEDFAVGGPMTNGGRGAVYLIYRRQPQVEGDYLLERLQLAPSHRDRLNGLMILGEVGEELGTAIAGGGVLNDDYNGDGFPDVLIGSPRANPSGAFRAGSVFVLFGGRNLLNPAGGSTVAQLRAAGDGMLMTGARAGDTAGTTVANAGDVNGDGIADILIAAPAASPRFLADPNDLSTETIGLDYNGDGIPDDLNQDGTPDDMTNAGMVYVVFGGRHLTGTIPLSLIGTPNLPGFVVVGKKGGDYLGGGITQADLLARGVSTAGDIDGDNRADLLIGSILADPEGKVDAGEVYLVYGFRP